MEVGDAFVCHEMGDTGFKRQRKIQQYAFDGVRRRQENLAADKTDLQKRLSANIEQPPKPDTRKAT